MRILCILSLTLIHAHTSANDEIIPPNSPPLTLVQNGEARGVIYVAPGSYPIVQSAAKELQDHVQLATGATLPIVHEIPEEEAVAVVLVGPSEEAEKRGAPSGEFAPEEFLLKSGHNWLALLGDDSEESPFSDRELFRGRPYGIRTGTLWAVHEFLRRSIGARWYMPGELGTVVEKTDTLVVHPIHERRRPSTEFRTLQLFGKVPKETPQTHPELAEWLLRLGTGSPGEYTLSHTFRYLSEKPSWNHYARRNKLFSTKPHIYGQLPDGRRDLDITSYGMGNLCLSHPDTVTEFVGMVREVADRNPNRREFSVNPNDVWIPCMCELCLASIDEVTREKIRATAKVQGDGKGGTQLRLSPELMDRFRAASGKLLAKFHVAVAREIYKTHPNLVLSVFGGYNNYGNPNHYRELGELPPNLGAQFTKTRASYWNTQYRDEVNRAIREWKKITPNLYVWEYYLWDGRWWRWRPRVSGYPVLFSKVLEEDIAFMREMGIVGEYTQGWNIGSANPGLTHLMAYLTERMLFDESLTAKQLLEEYYTKFYGAAHEEMKAFWEHAETCWMRDTMGLDERSQASEIIEILYTREDLAKLFGLLAAAKARLTPDSPEFRRVALIEKEMAPHRARLESNARPPAPQFQSTALFPAPPITGEFGDNWTRGGIILSDVDGFPENAKTSIKVAHSSTHLYLTFSAGKAPSGNLEGEAIVIEFQTHPNGEQTTALRVTPDGSVAIHPEMPGVERGAEVAASRGTEGWSGSLAVPWAALGIIPDASLSIPTRISRTVSEAPEQSWPRPGTSEFGTLHFLEE